MSNQRTTIAQEKKRKKKRERIGNDELMGIENSISMGLNR